MKKEMEVKEAIEFLERQKYSISEFENRYYKNSDNERIDCNKTFDRIQQLLRIGEMHNKYKEMWEEFYQFHNYWDMTEGSKTWNVGGRMIYTEQKYFPKVKKVITIEVEAKEYNESLQGRIEYYLGEIKRLNKGDIKVNIKETGDE